MAETVDVEEVRRRDPPPQQNAERPNCDTQITVVSHLRALAEGHLPDPVTAAAIYRPARAVHDEPIKVHFFQPMLGLAEGAITALARRSREIRQGRQPRHNVLKPTAHVLLAWDGTHLILFAVKSRPQGWVVKEVIGTFRKEAISCAPLKGQPYGLELTWPSDGFLRLRPLYITTDTKAITEALI